LEELDQYHFLTISKSEEKTANTTTFDPQGRDDISK
jgi:hypothetical protein